MTILEATWSCRGRDARKIIEFVNLRSCATVGDIAKHIGRGTAYVRKIVDELVELKAVKCEVYKRRVKDFFVMSISEGGDA